MARASVARPVLARERTITLLNHTRETIWPAAWPGSVPGRTGCTLPAGRSLTITVPDRWNARLWGRTGCRFDRGRGHCQTGDCGGLYQCRGWGQIPATLTEYDMDSFDQLDFYDVSMVDGSNLPMYITIAHGRTKNRIYANGCERGTGCTSTVRCPVALQVHTGGQGPKAAWMRAMMTDQGVVTIAEGDYVVQFGRRMGTWPGGHFRGADIPAGDYAYDVAFMYRFQDGRIAERWAVRDDLAMIQPLGGRLAPSHSSSDTLATPDLSHT